MFDFKSTNAAEGQMTEFIDVAGSPPPLADGNADLQAAPDDAEPIWIPSAGWNPPERVDVARRMLDVSRNLPGLDHQDIAAATASRDRTLVWLARSQRGQMAFGPADQERLEGCRLVLHGLLRELGILDVPPNDPSWNEQAESRIRSAPHKFMKRLYEEFGLDALRRDAQGGAVQGALANAFFSQLRYFPTRLAKATALQLFEKLHPEPIPDRILTGAPENLEAFQRTNPAWIHWNSKRWWFEHVGASARGLSHYLSFLVGDGIDLASGARAARARPYTEGGPAFQEAWRNLERAIDGFDKMVEEAHPTADMAVVLRHKKDLEAIRDDLAVKVSYFLREVNMLDPGKKAAIDAALIFLTEIVDTAGKVLIHSAMLSAAPAVGHVMTAAAVQSWSLVSYTVMAGVTTAIHNYQDTKDIARLALLRYCELHRQCQSKELPEEVPLAEIANILRYIDAHFETAEQANYKRFAERVVGPTLAQQSLEILTKERELEYLERRAATKTPAAMKALEENQRIEDEKDTLKCRQMRRIATYAEAYPLGLAVMSLLTQHARADGISPKDLQHAMKGVIEQLAFVYAAPTRAAENAIAEFEAAMQRKGVPVDAKLVFEWAQDVMISDRQAWFEDHVVADGHGTLTPNGKMALQRFEDVKSLVKDGLEFERLKTVALNIKPQLSPLDFERARERASLDVMRIARELAEARRNHESYQAEFRKYSERRFQDLDWTTKFGEQLASGATGSRDAVKRKIKYGIWTSNKNAIALGAAMVWIYNGGFSGIYFPEVGFNLADGMLSGGGVEAGFEIAAAVQTFPDKPGVQTRGVAGRSQVMAPTFVEIDFPRRGGLVESQAFGSTLEGHEPSPGAVS